MDVRTEIENGCARLLGIVDTGFATEKECWAPRAEAAPGIELGHGITVGVGVARGCIGIGVGFAREMSAVDAKMLCSGS